jgi:histidine triad (HIT) family protein
VTVDSSVNSDFYCDEALSGRTPVKVVLETDDVLAFHHTRPHWAVHIVVVPKAHIPSLTDLGGHSVEAVYRVIDVVRKVAAGVEREHGACRVATNLGAYQESKHLHFHVGCGEVLK